MDTKRPVHRISITTLGTTASHDWTTVIATLRAIRDAADKAPRPAFTSRAIRRGNHGDRPVAR